MASNHATTNNSGKKHKVEGPKKHIIAFCFSLVLTLIAFAAVIGGEINKDFIYIILIGTAILQVFVQLAFWMHMKDRGHLYATIAILGGVVIVITMVVMAVYWTWW